jgi:hypothetical protein
LDALIQLCTQPPEYLHPQDAVRYLYLLPLLRAFGALNYMTKKTEMVAKGTVADLCCEDKLGTLG